MKIRKSIAAVTASALILTGTPAVTTVAPVAQAQIIAPEPSSRLVIPADVTNFFHGLAPQMPRADVENILKIGAAWILIDIFLAVFGGVIAAILNLTGVAIAGSAEASSGK